MRNFLRDGLLHTFSLYITAAFYPGLIIPALFSSLLFVGFIFTLINYFVKPIIKLFLLPLNLLTLGLFRWVANVIILLILTQINQSIHVVSFTTNALAYSGFVVPPLTLTLILAYILASLILSLVYNLLDSILCG
ncbi:MAG: phage holin family protein [Patescibacteria group bacterium]